MANLIASLVSSKVHNVVEIRLADPTTYDQFHKVRSSGWVIWGFDDLATLDRNEWVEMGLVPPKVTTFSGGADLQAQLNDAGLSGIAWCAWVVTGQETPGFRMAIHRAAKAWSSYCAKPLTEEERDRLLKKRSDRLAKGRLVAAARREAEETTKG